MCERRVLWASTEAPGGIATYVRVMQQTPLWIDWNIRHIVTHRDGPALAKIAVFARGALVFIVELIRFRPSLVHLHAASDTSFIRKGILLWISRLAGVPVILHIHASAFPAYYESCFRPLRWAIRATLCRASAVVALGETWADRLRTIAPQARVVVIPNAVHPGRPVAHCGAGEPVHVVFLGQISDHKGTFRLLDAWAGLVSDFDMNDRRGTLAMLTVAGNGEIDRARECVRALHLDDTVHVRGWLSPNGVSELLDGAHVLVLPSRNEGQPMAVLEAMAKGLCVIATDVGTLPEMIGDGCGVIIAPDDTPAIACALRRVVHDHKLRAQYGAAAFARVTDQFDVRTTWRRLDALYCEAPR
jgi:glycosyltransferase involved in cell wall biosynthesis